MFGLGKTKMDSKAFCNDQWIKITSPERKSIWREFVERSNDAALKNADFEKYCVVMIAVYLQFLRSITIQSQGMHSDAVFDFYMCIDKKQEELDSSFQDYKTKFNQTWGSATSSDKMIDMVNTFELCMGINLQQETKEQLKMEFFALYTSMEEVLSKIKLV